MKKILFLVISLFICFGTSVYSQTITKKYYRSKANDSLKNPCIGDYVTVCAQITETIESVPILTPLPRVRVTFVIIDVDYLC